ncbi:SH3 domain and tetratricopeptide repeat-containing protein 2-like [Pristis pectinata]|uniref:SH3 domain and tetratricopeptide repeat-containing protein 2-like n=1 Tax=Pristis pectinata TaxID=685728 RepID=UPI00223D9EEE|nr:SH3 domain and tetratricopeptide repeat-containing protein 2-like [Pristis pectinata]XP_051870984.1 SH3 domain and tetratricopeptide repeat-containing protein 2-like [Pristis pectinata]XP_051870986.1 SH3 domain and tetratricopeptide repeat-containing protein 2-like [Pristis pectinata]XP_051870987.1 SH3 domain and tetratricopeptide repeat-containing protein 2-like [Pristis pectinata]XP_051870988.1 SH3 domain and tetratricopeptide repeat-containing protein 2-like [Pristis pectinata]
MPLMQKIELKASHGLKTAGIANKKHCNLDVVDSAEEEKGTKGFNNSLEPLPGTARYTDPLSDGTLNCNTQLSCTKAGEERECEFFSSRLVGIEENSTSTTTAVTTEKESPFVSLNSSGYWSDLQSQSVETDGESTHGEKMAVGKWERQSESQSLDQDRGCEEHSLGSSVKQEFPKDVTLSYSVIRQNSGLVDHELQEATRRRLCILESETKDVGVLFNELSSRLVSVHAEKDLFVLTFKTVEEIWKFTTYLSLGFVGRCLENLLLDQRFWLNVSLVEDVKIQVEVNEAHLSLMYLDLLLQEGHFFTRALSNIPKSEEQDLNICKEDLIMVKDIGNDSKWEATALSTNEKGLIPVSAPQALLYPFYQWFLRSRPGNFSGYEEYKQHHFPHSIGTGTCIATMDYKEAEVDELCFNKGEKIQIIGFLLSNLKWFLGKSLSTGETGFVPVKHMKPDQFKTLETHLLFLSDEEKTSLNMFRKPDERHCINLLNKLSQTDINTVYRLGELLPSTFEQHYLSDPAGLCHNDNIPDTNPFFYKELEQFIPEKHQPKHPRFYTDLGLEDMNDPEVFNPMLLFLNQEEYISHFRHFYDLNFSFIGSILYGVTEEKEVLQYLEMAREMAKMYNKHWAYCRICFLLGRLCAKRLRFSQARVYFEEAMTLVQGTFSDLYLLTALYVNLASVYLKLKMKEKSPTLVEKAATLLLCIPSHIFSSENELEILNILLKRAIIANDYYLEARTCFLITKLFLESGKSEETLSFAEHLQFLSNSFSFQSNIVPIDVHLILSCIYNKKCLPQLALAALRFAQPGSSSTLFGSLQKADFAIETIVKFNTQGTCIGEIPPQAALYLQEALDLASSTSDINILRDLNFALANLYQQHKLYKRAINYMAKSAEVSSCISDGGTFKAHLSLAWLYILNNQPIMASEILNSLLESSLKMHNPIQQGVVHNMLALSLRKHTRLKEALENCHYAIITAKESGIKCNQAIAHANFGSLTLCCKILPLPGCYLRKSLNLYLQMQDCCLEVGYAQVLLCLGQYYIDRGMRNEGRLHYELALLSAMKANNVHYQIQAIEQLCSFYEKVLHDKLKCIIYYEHWLLLAHKLKDKEQEMKMLPILSHLYFSFNTESSYRSSLSYTKQSLKNFIDLGMHGKEAEAWLMAGKTYYMMEQDELVELYLQAAVQTAQRMKNTHFTMKINEEAGDVFYNGPREREKAVSFYRDGAVPLARMTNDFDVELRLFNKLTELCISLNHLERALEYAIAAVRLSINTGDQLKERVAFHRLATVYYSYQQYEMAENYYLKALSLSSHLFVSPKEAKYYMKIYFRLGDITLHKLMDAHDAAGYFQMAFAAAIELGSKEDLFNICTKLANIYKNYIVNEDLCSQFVEKAKALSNKLHETKQSSSPN